MHTTGMHKTSTEKSIFVKRKLIFAKLFGASEASRENFWHFGIEKTDFP